jgi:hypothetical protein
MEEPASGRRYLVKIVTSGQAAKAVGLTRKQFLRWADSIPVIRRGRGWRYFDLKGVLEFFDTIREVPEIPALKPKRTAKTTSYKPTGTTGGWCSLEDCPELD